MSTEFKGTPGPWEVRDVDGELHVHAADTFSHGFRLEMRIASDVGGYNTKREDGSWDESQTEANARLIAAAPDLLEALLLCLHAVELAGWDGDLSAIKARSAIAKATGEAP